MITLIKKYENIGFDRDEILRYAGVKQEVGEISALLDECLKITEGIFEYKVCYAVCDVKFDGDLCDLEIFKTDSKTVTKVLAGSRKAVVFGATVGLRIDRLIARYGKISPSKAVILQAIGVERIETLCNKFCSDFAAEFAPLGVTARISAGYGDFSLKTQKDIFLCLDLPRKIGLYLNESLMMSPSKSVTAVMGFND